MIGLRNRGALDTVVQDEFENIIARIKAFFLKEHNEDGTHVVPEAGTNFMPIGGVIIWPTPTPPPGWLLCRGQAVSRVSYRDLFAVLSTTYGVGDGVLTFNLPDLQGRAAYGKAVTGTGSTLGGSFGSMDHTHTGPSHTHPFSGTTGQSNDNQNVDDTGAAFVEDVGIANHGHPFSGTTSAGGTGATGISNAPGLSMNYVIYTGVVV